MLEKAIPEATPRRRTFLHACICNQYTLLYYIDDAGGISPHGSTGPAVVVSTRIWFWKSWMPAFSLSMLSISCFKRRAKGTLDLLVLGLDVFGACVLRASATVWVFPTLRRQPRPLPWSCLLAYATVSLCSRRPTQRRLAGRLRYTCWPCPTSPRRAWTRWAHQPGQGTPNAFHAPESYAR